MRWQIKSINYDPLKWQPRSPAKVPSSRAPLSPVLCFTASHSHRASQRLRSNINSGIKDTDLIYFLLPLSISWQNADADAAACWRFNVQNALKFKACARQCYVHSTRNRSVSWLESLGSRLASILGSPSVISCAPLAPATVKRDTLPHACTLQYPPTPCPLP